MDLRIIWRSNGPKFNEKQHLDGNILFQFIIFFFWNLINLRKKYSVLQLVDIYTANKIIALTPDKLRNRFEELEELLKKEDPKE